MEALGVAASIIAVVQIAEKILTLCGKYSLGAKDAKTDIERLSNEITALRNVLTIVKDLAQGPNAAKLPALNTLPGAIDQCSAELVDLISCLDPGKRRQLMNNLGLRLTWPFKSEDVNKRIAALERSKATINLALNTDQR
jgi:hypothetical protein